MNSKLMLILLLSGLAISLVISGIWINRLDYSQENNTVDTESIGKQIEYLQEIQIEASRVIMEDEKVRELIDGKEHLKILEIIHNGSYVDDFYRIGFQYKKLEECKGYRMVGGKIYKFSIDLSNKTVLSVDEAENQNPDMREIKDEGFLDGAYISVHSLALTRSYIGSFQPGWQKWLYCFRVEGVGDVRLKPDSSTKTHGWGSLKHHLAVKEIYNKEMFYFSTNEPDPEGKKAGCNENKLPCFESMCDGELITCEVSYLRDGSVWNFIRSRNWPSDANFSYIWDVWVRPNQTIMFDVAVVFQSIENGRNTHEVTHDWRVILITPPPPHELSGSEMKEYGIEMMKYNCNYYAHNPVIFVKKGCEVI